LSIGWRGKSAQAAKKGWTRARREGHKQASFFLDEHMTLQRRWAMALVTVFGASGFIGSSVVRRLAQAGWRVRAAVRHPNEALFLKPMGEVGQIQVVPADVRSDALVAACVAGADVVINLVGVLSQGGGQTFEALHAQAPGRIGRAAAAAGIKTVVHVSALAADAASDSVYARTKAEGEQALRAAFPQAIIMRPSVVFGPDDNFINRFASLLRLSPVFPLVYGGKTRFQPVYVGDVAQAITNAMAADQSGDQAPGQTFELGGPEVMTLRDIVERIMRAEGRKRLLVPYPAALMKCHAWFLQMLPNPVLTVDQVRLLAHDSVVREGAPDLAALGIAATPLGAILPTYIKRFRKSGNYEISVV
jgi:NADH dehydrogenase